MAAKINPFTGSIELTDLQSGIALTCVSDAGMTPSKTEIGIATLAGYGDDYFNNHFYLQVITGAHELLTIDTAPAPADFSVGTTLTGVSSGETCVVVAKLTPTTYIVKSRSAAFDDGEVIGDGVNSVDCAAGYPTFTAAAAPEHEVRKITDYDSSTGLFTVDTFSQVVEPASDILVLHESLAALSQGVINRVAGKSQVFVKVVAAAADAGDVTLATVNTQACIIDAVTIVADGATSADLTSIGIYGGTSKVVTFIDTADGARANLNAVDKQVSAVSAVVLHPGKSIVITLTGTGATTVNFTVCIAFRAAADGGYLA